MKTPREWIAANETLTEALVMAIQADALNHAINLCDEQTEPRNEEEADYSNGHANRGIENCQQSIREAISKLPEFTGNENAVRQRILAYAADICDSQLTDNSNINIGVFNCQSAIRRAAGFPEAIALTFLRQ